MTCDKFNPCLNGGTCHELSPGDIKRVVQEDSGGILQRVQYAALTDSELQRQLRFRTWCTCPPDFAGYSCQTKYSGPWTGQWLMFAAICVATGLVVSIIIAVWYCYFSNVDRKRYRETESHQATVDPSHTTTSPIESEATNKRNSNENETKINVNMSNYFDEVTSLETQHVKVDSLNRVVGCVSLLQNRTANSEFTEISESTNRSSSTREASGSNEISESKVESESSTIMNLPTTVSFSSERSRIHSSGSRRKRNSTTLVRRSNLFDVELASIVTSSETFQDDAVTDRLVTRSDQLAPPTSTDTADRTAHLATCDSLTCAVHLKNLLENEIKLEFPKISIESNTTKPRRDYCDCARPMPSSNKSASLHSSRLANRSVKVRHMLEDALNFGQSPTGTTDLLQVARNCSPYLLDGVESDVSNDILDEEMSITDSFTDCLEDIGADFR